MPSNAQSGAAPIERRFAVPGLTLTAKEWGSPGGVPVLAAHGWLDNSGTFDLLAPLLAGTHFVAVDLAGHGTSDFRSADSGYNLWQDVGELLEVAEQLGWRRFSLLGHSRGAAIAMLFAATFPERIDKLVLIEGGLPFPGEADEAPLELAKALLERRGAAERSGRVFADRATAIRERANGFSKITIEAAEILARRSLEAVPGGYRWRADQRLKAPSELKLTPELVRAFVRRVTAPTLVVMAERSPFSERPIFRELLPKLASFELATLPGGHHLHVENAAPAIAARVQAFLTGAAPGAAVGREQGHGRGAP